MKTAWLLVAVMAVAALYVFDVASTRRLLDGAGAEVVSQVQGAITAVREAFPDPPRR